MKDDLEASSARTHRGFEVSRLGSPQPADDAPPSLDEVSEREKLQRIQDAFSRATGLNSVIVDAQGRPWTNPSGTSAACGALHLGPTTQACIATHAGLGKEARDGRDTIVRTCGSCSLTEAVAPIFIGALHIGSWVCGPVQLSEEGATNSPVGVPTMTQERFEDIVALMRETVQGLCAQGRCILELKAVVRSRGRMEQHLDDVINALADPVFVKDDQHRWVTLNSSFCDFMGVPKEDLLGRSDFDFFPVEEARVFWRNDDDVLETGETSVSEEQFTDASGTTHIIATKKTLFLGDGGTKYIVGVIRDITDRRKIEDTLSRRQEKLEELVAERTKALSAMNRALQQEVDDRRRAEAEKREMQAQLLHNQKLEAIGRLAGGIAHDFNNLLTGIFGHVTLALRDEQTGEGAKDSLLQVREAARRAADLTKQLLAFSRKQIIEPRVIDLNALIDNLRRLLERIIGEDIQLLTQYDPRLGSVRVDPVQIEQVVVNLVVNARDAMPQGGRLRIETKSRKILDAGPLADDEPPPGDYAVLVVSDTGVGMDEDTLSRVFEPFFTTKQKGRGTGLGLATVYGIVRQHRGSIVVNSSPQSGSVFEVLLPCVDHTEHKTNLPPEERLTGGSETILLVEDEEIVRHATRGMLEYLGYKVLVAEDGASALSASEGHKGTIDLLMTDVVMPVMNGRELAEKLCELRPTMRVLYTSGYTDDVIVHHGVLDEGVNFVAKPFDSAELARRIRKALD